MFANTLSEGRILVMMRLLNFGDFVQNSYYRFLHQLHDEQNELARYERNSDFWMMIPGNLSSAAFLLILVPMVFSGSVSISAFFVILGSISRFPSALFNLLNTGVRLRGRSLDYQYLQKLLATEPMINEEYAEDLQLDHCPTLLVNHLSFKYPKQDAFAVSDCSLTITPFEKIAVVGTNGSGKTSLARLLAKVYSPLYGNIMVDNELLSGVTQRSWMRNALYLGQQFRILELEVDYAITGNALSSLSSQDHERFEKAVRIAGTDEFIEPLTNGYSTQIGEQWPEGRGFSGGQLQRLALAASIYRLLDPEVKIGIFDEPMSDCDIETRQKFYRSITKEMSDKTIIVIAHDPFFLHYFDRVIEMENGSINRDLRREGIAEYQRKIIQPDE